MVQIDSVQEEGFVLCHFYVNIYTINIALLKLFFLVL